MKLRDYQRAAVAHLQAHPRAALFLDMGLGKTAVVLSALTPEHLPALVLAPKRVAAEVWPAERELWRPDLTLVHAAASSPGKRRALLDRDADITVLGVDNLADALDYPGRWRTVVIDESSKFKSHKSERFKTARALVWPHVQQVWELTGTPSPNGLLDLWSQLYLLDKGERLGRNITQYRNRYFEVGTFRNGRPAILPNGTVASWAPKAGAEESIHRKLEDLCLSMGTEGRVELPPVTYNRLTVHLPATSMRHYRKLKKDLVLDLDMLGDITHSAASAGVLSAKLSQIAAGFLYDDDAGVTGSGAYTELHRERVNAVVEVAEGTGSPVLVFYRFRAELEMLRKAFKKAGVAAEHIDDAPDTIKRWNRGEVPVMLAHPASAGHGLNLQHGGHTIVWSSLPWALDEWEQANKRLARSGQQHPVMVHTVVAPRTVDEAILDALTHKRSVQDALLDHLESPL